MPMRLPKDSLLLIRQVKTFAIETTLATRSYASLVKRAQERGYQVVLLFFWLPSPGMAVERVAKRVSEGGHNIPIETIHRRYWLGVQNFFNIFAPIVDLWVLYENIDKTIKIASSKGILDKEKFSKIRELCQIKKI